MRIRAACIASVALLAVSALAARKLEVKDLPPMVQKTILDQTKGAEIKGLSKETEKGATSYEVETMVSGKHRDFVVSVQGVVTEVEEETALDSIPAAARAAIQKKAGSGKVSRVEAMTRVGSTDKLYEAFFTDTGGKKHAVLVKADGTQTKD